MSTEICEAVFFDYLDHNEKPSLVVLEVTNLSVPNGLLNDLKLYAGLSERLDALIRRDDPKLDAMYSITHLYRYNCELFLRSLYYIGKTDQGWINSGTIDPGFAASFRPSKEQQRESLYPTAGLNWLALKRIIDRCDSDGIALRLIASPYLPAFRDGLSHYDSWASAFRAALPNSELFCDYTLSLDDSAYFADMLHINRKGSSALLDLLIQDRVFDLGDL